MLKHLKCFAFLVLLAIGGCVSMPTGPSVLVLPGTGKSFEQFRVDDFQCRQYIHDLLGGATPSVVANEAAISNAAVGTALGAAAGAAIAGGHGAAIGAGSGLVAGSMAGAGTAGVSGYVAQMRYDHGYLQCMYAKGHRIPVSAEFLDETRPGSNMPSAVPPPPPPPSATLPPSKTQPPPPKRRRPR